MRGKWREVPGADLSVQATVVHCREARVGIHSARWALHGDLARRRRPVLAEEAVVEPRGGAGVVEVGVQAHDGAGELGGGAAAVARDGVARKGGAADGGARAGLEAYRGVVVLVKVGEVRVCRGAAGV